MVAVVVCELVHLVALEMGLPKHRAGRPATPLDEEAVVRDYRSGIGSAELAKRHRVAWRRLRLVLQKHGALWRKYACEAVQPDDPYRCLALAIIAAACQDWRTGRYPYDLWPREDPRQELLAYFSSFGFLDDCQLAEVSAESVVRSNGVPVEIDEVGAGLSNQRETCYNGSAE